MAQEERSAGDEEIRAHEGSAHGEQETRRSRNMEEARMVSSSQGQQETRG